MKLFQLLVSENLSAVFLYFIVLFANIDYTGILDYAIKATIGSIIWFVFKLLGEHLLLKLKKKHDAQHQNTNNDNQNTNNQN